MKNEFQFRVYAEDQIRARLLEAENYRMLNQLRKHYPKGISQSWHSVLKYLGHGLTVLGERIDNLESSLLTGSKYETGFD